MSRIPDEKNSLFPVLVMAGFTLLLVAALVLRVYRADRDLGMIRVEEIQARLAAESGVSYAVEKMRSMIAASDRAGSVEALTAMFFSEKIETDSWISFGQKSDAYFRIISIRKVIGDDDPLTSLLDESHRYRILSEGRCGRFHYSTAAIVQLYDLVKRFAVFSSLDEFYYGKPIQEWVESAGSLESFVKANSELFKSGALSRFGVCHDPGLLYRVFGSDDSVAFKAASESVSPPGAYSRLYSRGGVSPCLGPMYCETPVIVDSHVFRGPVQTASYFYRRGNAQPRITMGNTELAMNSSLRVQHAADSLEGKNPGDMLVDSDSALYASFIPQWRPDFVFLRELARNRGIYIDAKGKGFFNQKPVMTDYHPGEARLYSDSYKGPNSTKYEQDDLDEKYVVLSSELLYQDYNNIDSANLQGARIIFSERSVYLRGEIGADLIIVTPGHIFITGPTNVDSGFNLLLVAGAGTALSTVDLENYIKESSPGPEFIDAASEWLIRAVIYKPGAGVYSSESRPQAGFPMNFRRLFSGKSLRIRIEGACIGGNLQRWIDNSEPDSLRVTHLPDSADRLYVRPVSVNVLRMRSVAEK